ncbi:MAG: aminopeptidase [Bacillota bacterium]|nr:aminopeptidase [Bacillota bacterium]MDW7684855.1 aminopeptidase [Bacillota bacterium]
MDQTMLNKYAELVAAAGVNIQKGQSLVITSPLECAPFVRAVAKAAYQAGARDVVVNWRDELLAKIRYTHAPDDVFTHFPDWLKDMYTSYARDGAAFLNVAASDPELMSDVKPERIAAEHKAASTALKDYIQRRMSNLNRWCVVSAPTGAWAQKVFPELSEAEAVEKLWNVIFRTVRADREDPLAAWEEHKSNLRSRTQRLNQYQLRQLHLYNTLGTDLTVELPENHIWLGGSDFTPEGMEFIPNLPTEEIFTLPKKDGVNGRVVSSMPLNYNGNLVRDFSLTFENGRIIDYQAQSGYDTLKNMLETDDGANYLGEIALVPYDSPISKENILFYNTLFDENASSHLAIGRAYPLCLKDSQSMSEEQLTQRGVNYSLIHTDFMIGTKDLTITGTTQSGEKVPVFVGGNFAF